MLNHIVYYVDEVAVRGMSNLPCPMLDDGFSLSFFFAELSTDAFRIGLVKHGS